MISIVTAMVTAMLMQVSAAAPDPARIKGYAIMLAGTQGFDYDPATVELRYVSSEADMDHRWVCGEIAGTLRSGEKLDFRGFIFNTKRRIFFFQPVERRVDRETYLLEQADYHSASANWC